MTPDMSYVGTVGLARCMYESAVNEYALDESMLMQDFNEVRAVREGTVLESEMYAIQEASIKGFFEKAKEILTKLGQKIMGVFRTVYAKLTKWIVRNGKAYVALHRKTVLTKDISKLTIKKYRMPKSFDVSAATNTIKLNIGNINIENPTKHAGTPDEYGKSLLKQYLANKDTSEYPKFLMDSAFEEEKDIEGSKISGRLTKILDNVSTGSKPIKDLKKTEKDLIKKIKEAKQGLDKLEKKITGNDNKTDSDSKKLEGIPYVRAEVGALQTAVNTITSAAIKVCRYGIKQDRSVIAQIVAYSPKSESNIYMIEAAEDAEDEFDEEMDSPEETEVAEDMPEFEDIETDSSDDDDE